MLEMHIYMLEMHINKHSVVTRALICRALQTVDTAMSDVCANDWVAAMKQSCLACYYIIAILKEQQLGEQRDVSRYVMNV